jgi:hypothetical protein
MYQASQQNNPNGSAGSAQDSASQQGSGQGATEDVTDVDYEEVK